MVAVQRDTAIPVRGAREQRLGEAAGELVFRVVAAFGGAQHVHRRGEPLITEQPLMRGGIVRLDEDLMPLLQLYRRAGTGELIVIQAPLNVEVGFVRSVG